MKKKCNVKTICFIIMVVAILFLPATVMAKPAKKTVKKAYTSYIQQYKSKVSYGRAYYKIVDLNKDGVSECIVQYQDGMKCRIIILGYKKKKVVEILNSTGMEMIHYNKKKNRVCIYYSSGAVTGRAEICKLSGSKLKTTDYYESSYSGSGVSYKHKKKSLTEEKYYSELRNIWNSWKDVSPFTKGTIL